MSSIGLSLISRVSLLSYFFFFQAEDGIRYLLVTGVQTCALPISVRSNFGYRLSTAWHPARGDLQGFPTSHLASHGKIGSNAAHGKERPARFRHTNTGKLPAGSIR